MIPAEFIARYGVTRYRQVTVQGANDTIIPPNPNRYLLVFWGTSIDTTITPAGQGQDSADSIVWNTTDKPIVFDHSHDGALVNMAFRIAPTVAGQTYTIIEGVMKGLFDPKQGE